MSMLSLSLLLNITCIGILHFLFGDTRVGRLGAPRSCAGLQVFLAIFTIAVFPFFTDSNTLYDDIYLPNIASPIALMLQSSDFGYEFPSLWGGFVTIVLIPNIGSGVIGGFAWYLSAFLGRAIYRQISDKRT